MNLILTPNRNLPLPVDATFGQQIRNYVMAPYRLVKDTRTGFETAQVGDVLDGDLDGFINAYLRSSKDKQKDTHT